MKTKTTQKTTNWQFIILLSLLAGFVILSWKIYEHYNFILLERAQLSEWISPLNRWQLILSVCIPPIAGGLADYFTKKGKNYLFITISMGITAMLFISTAIITGNTFTRNLQSALPIMMILWMTGMNLFFSPAMNLIEKSAKRAQLPIAIGIIIFVADLVYALNEHIINSVEIIGSVWIFAGAGIALSLLGYFYSQFSKNLPLYIHSEYPSDPMIIWLFRAFTIGLFGGLSKGIFKLDSLQNVSHYIPFTDILSLIVFTSAFVALGLGFLLQKHSCVKTIFIGAVFNLLGIVITLFVSGILMSMLSLCLIVLGISMISLSIYSVALLRVPETKHNLAFGLFIGGFALSDFIINSILHS